jgi:hypothetical protein
MVSWLRATPEEGTIPIQLTEVLPSGFSINHSYFVRRKSPPRITVSFTQEYNRDSAETHLLAQSVSSLLLEQPNPPASQQIGRPAALGDRLRAADRSLWADKYEASQFIHLVTEDYVNREAVLWLKSWDTTVFGQVSRETFSAIANQRKEGRKDVLMVAGAPGCGKTTLAKVVALHCGYVPFLIDCTIEASAANLLQKVANAMSIQSITEGQHEGQAWKPKPLCVILDQVEALDKVIYRQATLGHLEQMVKKPLKRPIIVIVADFYTPGLKVLKPHCQILQCKLNPAARLQARLADITRAEGLHVDTNVLLYLLTHNNNDIRSSLNSLQMLFISRPLSSYVTLDEAKTCLGKDLRHSAFELWKAIFSKKDLSGIQKMVMDNGEYELINQGIYENFLNVESPDYEFQHNSLLLDFLTLDNMIELRTKEKQQFELLPLHSLPARLANHCFNASFSEMHFPVMSVHVAKAVTEGWETARGLEVDARGKPGKIAVQTTLEEVWPYILPMINPTACESAESFPHWELFHSLGFSIVNKAVEPAIHRLIRLPANANLDPSVISWYERLQNTPKTHAAKSVMDVIKDTTVTKRKRQTHEGVSVWYQYHEGLTNAVKRKVRICDLIRP